MQVLSVRSEASFLQEAADKINRIVQSSLVSAGESNQEELLSNNKIDETKSSNQDKLVRTGEITPFQAAEKSIEVEQCTGYEVEKLLQYK